MQSIIDALYYGGIDPCMAVVSDPEYKKRSKDLADLTNRFTEALPSEYHDGLHYILSKQSDLSAYLEKALFSTGFFLGARILLEALQFDPQ